MGVSRVLAKYIVSVDYKALSPAAVKMAKKLILDSLACAVAGSSVVGMQRLRELIKGWGGEEESAIVTFGDRVPAPYAALANASMGRALDFDDCHDAGPTHPAVPAVFAGFAMAEHRGGVGGKEFIVAVVLGIDLTCRMAGSSPVRMLQGYGWDYSGIYGYFGAAVTSAKILRLEEEKILNAMGIAYKQTSGTMCQHAEGHDAKAMGSGFAAMGGVISAQMAIKGLTGGDEPIEGKWGIYDVYLRGKCNLDYLTGKLGKYFMVENDSIKPYPCCRSIHAAIDTTLSLVKKKGIDPQDVESVTVYVGPYTFGICEPMEIKQNPPNSLAAQYSIPWSLANAIIHRSLEPKHFFSENLKNQKARQLARKVVTKLDPQLSRVGGREPALVEIRTKGGKVYSKRAGDPLGSPRNPLSKEQLAEKFRSCASYAVKPIPKENLSLAMQMVEELEDVNDVGQVIRLL